MCPCSIAGNTALVPLEGLRRGLRNDGMDGWPFIREPLSELSRVCPLTGAIWPASVVVFVIDQRLQDIHTLRRALSCTYSGTSP